MTPKVVAISKTRNFEIAGHPRTGTLISMDFFYRFGVAIVFVLCVLASITLAVAVLASAAVVVFAAFIVCLLVLVASMCHEEFKSKEKPSDPVS